MQAQEMPLTTGEARLETTEVCAVCDGSGFLIGDDDAEVQCEACDGMGKVPQGLEAA